MKHIIPAILVSVPVLATCLVANSGQPGLQQVQSALTGAAPAQVVFATAGQSQSLVGPGGSAQNYCQSSINSYGTAAVMGYSGSLSLAQGTFGLTVDGVPYDPRSWGVFTYGQTPMNVPFGNGWLCINPLAGLGRLSNQPLTSTILGRSMIDAPAEFAAFAPGSTWNFQFWYRNPAGATPAGGGATFNLSDGLRVQFAP